MKKLFTCLYGSGLYGTKTPTSDRDVKHIVLPDLEDLLLAKKIVNTVKKTNNEKNTRNGVDDVDEEFIPLQVFAKDFIGGQTYALELAFAMDGDHAEQTFYNRIGMPLEDRVEVIRDAMWEENDYHEPLFMTFVKELRENFLTSNIKAMMGYVVNQANLYSFKGERLNVAREFKDVLVANLGKDNEFAELSINEVLDMQGELGLKSRTSLVFDSLNLAAKYPKYFKESEYDIGHDRMRPCFVLLEKTLPFTMKLGHAITVVDTIVKKYGSRADAASENNVDWKATMHALRIVDQGLMVLGEHKMEFPFKPDYVAKLLQIKRGELPLDPIKDELLQKMEQLKGLEKTTTLPELNNELREKFEAFMTVWLKRFYGLK